MPTPIEELNEDITYVMRTHSSKIAIRKWPHCWELTVRSVTRLPSCL